MPSTPQPLERQSGAFDNGVFWPPGDIDLSPYEAPIPRLRHAVADGGMFYRHYHHNPTICRRREPSRHRCGRLRG